MRILGGLRAAVSAVAVASLVSACSAHGARPVPESGSPQSASRHALVFVTPTPDPTATPAPGTLAAACGGVQDCTNIRLVGLLDVTLTKRPSNPKLNDATFTYANVDGDKFASCEGKQLWTGNGNGNGDGGFSRFNDLPFVTQPGPVSFFAGSTTFQLPCNGNRDRSGAYYLAMIAFSSIGTTFQALSGPVQENANTVSFAAAQGFATMQPAQAYAFFLIRNTNPDVVLPTPAPSGKGGGLGGGLSLGG